MEASRTYFSPDLITVSLDVRLEPGPLNVDGFTSRVCSQALDSCLVNDLRHYRSWRHIDRSYWWRWRDIDRLWLRLGHLRARNSIAVANSISPSNSRCWRWNPLNRSWWWRRYVDRLRRDIDWLERLVLISILFKLESGHVLVMASPRRSHPFTATEVRINTVNSVGNPNVTTSLIVDSISSDACIASYALADVLIYYRLRSYIDGLYNSRRRDMVV